VTIVGVLAWKFVEAEHVINNEPKLYAELEKLDAQEQNELRRLIRSGIMSVGPPLLERFGPKLALYTATFLGNGESKRCTGRF
jgi:hypothetical protein